MEALKALDPKEVKAELSDVQNRCPDAPSVGGLCRGSGLCKRDRRGWGDFFQRAGFNSVQGQLGMPQSFENSWEDTLVM